MAHRTGATFLAQQLQIEALGACFGPKCWSLEVNSEQILASSFVGLAMISYNTDLPKYEHSWLVVIWFTSASALAALGLAIQVLAWRGYHAWRRHREQRTRTLSGLRASTSSLGSSSLVLLDLSCLLYVFLTQLTLL